MAGEAGQALRAELDEILSEKVSEAVESSTLDPPEVNWRPGQVEEAVRSLNRSVQSGLAGAKASPHTILNRVDFDRGRRGVAGTVGKIEVWRGVA